MSLEPHRPCSRSDHICPDKHVLSEDEKKTQEYARAASHCLHACAHFTFELADTTRWLSDMYRGLLFPAWQGTPSTRCCMKPTEDGTRLSFRRSHRLCTCSDSYVSFHPCVTYVSCGRADVQGSDLGTTHPSVDYQLQTQGECAVYWAGPGGVC